MYKKAQYKNTSSCDLGRLKSACPLNAMPACNLRCDRVAAERDRLRCCRQHMCGACTTKVLKLEYKTRRFRVSCPFCRRLTLVPTKRVKTLMAENCPDHAMVMDSEEGPVAVVHVPKDGCYGDKSTLQLLPTYMLALLADLMDEIDLLSAELASAQERCKTLEERDGVRPVSPWRGTILDQLLAPAGASEEAASRQAAA